MKRSLLEARMDTSLNLPVKAHPEATLRAVADLPESVRKALSKSMSDGTRSVHKFNWRHFSNWHEMRTGLNVSLPIEPGFIAEYLVFYSDPDNPKGWLSLHWNQSWPLSQ